MEMMPPYEVGKSMGELAGWLERWINQPGHFRPLEPTALSHEINVLLFEITNPNY
jgi:hypothetical protein